MTRCATPSSSAGIWRARTLNVVSRFKAVMTSSGVPEAWTWPLASITIRSNQPMARSRSWIEARMVRFVSRMVCSR